MGLPRQRHLLTVFFLRLRSRSWTVGGAPLRDDQEPAHPGLAACHSRLLTRRTSAVAPASASLVTQPHLALRVGDINLTWDGNTSGSFLVAKLDATDAGGGALFDLELSSDIFVPYPLGLARFIGCVKYIADPAGLTSGDGGADSAT